MSPLLSDIATGAVVFAATNIDDMLLLAAFFADPQMRWGAVVFGQFLGVGALVAISALAALLALAVPEGWIALLGLVPLFLGLQRSMDLRAVFRDAGADAQDRRVPDRERDAEARIGSQAVAVAAVTVANGGDNLGVYIPMFASAPAALPTWAIVFSVMTGLWCWLGRLLVNNRVLVAPIRRYGHLALPVVLVGLGLYILSGAAALVR